MMVLATIDCACIAFYRSDHSFVQSLVLSLPPQLETPQGYYILWLQLKRLWLAAEGAGRRLASLPGLRGILSGGQVIGDPKSSFSFFSAPPQAARRR
jgi:hypothetical protein